MEPRRREELDSAYLFNVMGNWAINIQGIGCHHNENPDIDADLAAAAFFAKLREMGQHVESATFTYGGKVDLAAQGKDVLLSDTVTCNS